MRTPDCISVVFRLKHNTQLRDFHDMVKDNAPYSPLPAFKDTIIIPKSAPNEAVNITESRLNMTRGKTAAIQRPEPTDATLLYLEAKRSWRWSEGPSEGIRRIRRGFPEEEPSDTANERGQAQAAPSGGAAAIRPATPRAFPSARRASSRCWTRRAAAPWAQAHARTWGARARARPS